MTISFSKIQIQGNVGKDCEVKALQSGEKMCLFSVAINKSTKAKDGTWSSKTTWWNVVCYGDYFAQQKDKIKKGVCVFVEGEVLVEDYTDAHGVDKKAYKIIAKSLLIDYATTEKHDAKESVYIKESNTQIDDDIPF